MNKRYYTVVYEITNEDSFNKHVATAVAALSVEEGDGNQLAEGLRVVACGTGDAMSRDDALNTWLQEKGEDPDEIIANVLEAQGIDDEDIGLIIG